MLLARFLFITLVLLISCNKAQIFEDQLGEVDWRYDYPLGVGLGSSKNNDIYSTLLEGSDCLLVIHGQLLTCISLSSTSSHSLQNNSTSTSRWRQQLCETNESGCVIEKIALVASLPKATPSSSESQIVLVVVKTIKNYKVSCFFAKLGVLLWETVLDVIPSTTDLPADMQLLQDDIVHDRLVSVLVGNNVFLLSLLVGSINRSYSPPPPPNHSFIVVIKLLSDSIDGAVTAVGCLQSVDKMCTKLLLLAGGKGEGGLSLIEGGRVMSDRFSPSSVAVAVADRVVMVLQGKPSSQVVIVCIDIIATSTTTSFSDHHKEEVLPLPPGPLPPPSTWSLTWSTTQQHLTLCTDLSICKNFCPITGAEKRKWQECWSPPFNTTTSSTTTSFQSVLHPSVVGPLYRGGPPPVRHFSLFTTSSLIHGRQQQHYLFMVTSVGDSLLFATTSLSPSSNEEVRLLWRRDEGFRSVETAHLLDGTQKEVDAQKEVDTIGIVQRLLMQWSGDKSSSEGGGALFGFYKVAVLLSRGGGDLSNNKGVLFSSCGIQVTGVDLSTKTTLWKVTMTLLCY